MVTKKVPVKHRKDFDPEKLTKEKVEHHGSDNKKHTVNVPKYKAGDSVEVFCHAVGEFVTRMKTAGAGPEHWQNHFLSASDGQAQKE